MTDTAAAPARRTAPSWLEYFQVLPLGVYIVSFFLPAARSPHMEVMGWEACWYSMRLIEECFFTGWANLFFLAGVVSWWRRSWSLCRTCAFAAVVMATTVLFDPVWSKTLALGYVLWLSSFILLALGGEAMALRFPTPAPESAGRLRRWAVPLILCLCLVLFVIQVGVSQAE